MAVMTEQERRVFQRTKIKVYITRSCQGRKDDDSPMEKYRVGQVVEMAHKYADELISINKGVEVGTSLHAAILAQKAAEEKSAPKKEK